MELNILLFAAGMLIGITLVSIYHDYEHYKHEQWIQQQCDLAYNQQNKEIDPID